MDGVKFLIAVAKGMHNNAGASVFKDALLDNVDQLYNLDYVDRHGYMHYPPEAKGDSPPSSYTQLLDDIVEPAKEAYKQSQRARALPLLPAHVPAGAYSPSSPAYNPAAPAYVPPAVP